MNASGISLPEHDDAESIVRASIQKLLREYIEAPLFNAREKDYQAVLFAMLRAGFPGQVAATFALANGRSNTRHRWSEPRTSRVHLEMGFGQKGQAGAATRPDIVVLRDHPVVLRCSVDGPADIQETLRVEDVEVAIELKAAPSQNVGEARKFADDVVKLARVQRVHRGLRCFAAVIDKSISIPCASSIGLRVEDWLALVSGDLRYRDTQPNEPFVEVWFVDSRLIVPRRVFFAASDTA